MPNLYGKPGSDFKGGDGWSNSEQGAEAPTAAPTERKRTSDDGASLLHDLNNALVAILLNAQVIEWKLPSYSRLKRNVHEVERGAQRGAIIVKRLLAMLNAELGIIEGEAQRAQLQQPSESQVTSSDEWANEPGDLLSCFPESSMSEAGS